MSYDGDSSDLTTEDIIYPSYSGYQTAYGHIDSSYDYDYCTLCVTSSGYYNITSTGDTSSSIDGHGIITSTSGVANNYNTGLYLDSNFSYLVRVFGRTAGENYSVTVTPGSQNAFIDGDSADLTNADYFYPYLGRYQTNSGHTDSYGDMDFAPIYPRTSAYYNLSSTGNTESAIYDATTGNWLYGDSYQSNIYINASHSNYLFVRGYTSGESYSATITPRYVTDGDSSDLTTDTYLYPNYSGYKYGYGHTDFYGDLDYANLNLHTSGYYNVTSTGNTAAYIYDISADSLAYGSSYQSGLYLYSGHNYYIGVYGYTTGERYSVTVDRV